MTEKCNDQKCYKHGHVRVRGGRMEAQVVSANAKHTVSVERPLTAYLSKYRRWARENSRIIAHNPACINAKLGDRVVIGETRKLSRTKAWTILEVVGQKGEKHEGV
ncbi:MAG TPA: 30S ribosomal protein S17 [Candidatus Bilamarchaeaceae archaeon]|nr:30S ribosomal protein S17 [Candidatus Bilamarchaeaceae archaeon]